MQTDFFERENMDTQTPIVASAKQFAAEVYKDLVRNNTEKTYLFVHAEEVAALVEHAGGSPEQIAAAWLHDVVEDTPVTLEEIRERFGDVIAVIVDGLTDPPEYKGMQLLERKTLQAKRVAGKCRSVMLVKIADQISNTRLVTRDPPVKWEPIMSVWYVEGARRIVEQCRGTNVFLENAFDEAHAASVARWGKFLG